MLKITNPHDLEPSCRPKCVEIKLNLDLRYLCVKLREIKFSAEPFVHEFGPRLHKIIFEIKILVTHGVVWLIADA